MCVSFPPRASPRRWRLPELAGPPELAELAGLAAQPRGDNDNDNTNDNSNDNNDNDNSSSSSTTTTTTSNNITNDNDEYDNDDNDNDNNTRRRCRGCSRSRCACRRLRSARGPRGLAGTARRGLLLIITCIITISGYCRVQGLILTVTYCLLFIVIIIVIVIIV